jgi:hypothetical protein
MARTHCCLPRKWLVLLLAETTEALAPTFDVVVVGGGAAGIFASIAAAREGARVLCLESGASPLRKVRISGGGRCNVMHDSATWDPRGARDLLKARYPRGASQLVGPLSSRFSPLETKAWFEAEGVMLKREADGRVFPTTDDSATIVDALLSAADRAGVQLRTRAKIASAVRRDGDGFLLLGAGAAETSSDDGSPWTVEARSLVLATGSSSHHLAADLGHEILPLLPSLFSFRLSPGGMLDASLAGVSVLDAELTLQPPPPPPVAAAADAGEHSEADGKTGGSGAAGNSVGSNGAAGNTAGGSKKRRRAGSTKPVSARGPVLVTHRGLSGPAALRLSSFGAAEFAAAGYHGHLQLNLSPAHTPAEAISILEACKTRPDTRLKQMSTVNPFGLPRRLWAAAVAAAGVDGGKRWDAMTKAELNRLQRATQAAPLAFSGKDSNKVHPFTLRYHTPLSRPNASPAPVGVVAVSSGAYDFTPAFTHPYGGSPRLKSLRPSFTHFIHDPLSYAPLSHTHIRGAARLFGQGFE